MTYESLGFNPAPGSSDRGQDMVSRLRSATNALAEMERTLNGAGNSDWEGHTATAFYGLVDEDLKPRVTEAHQSFSSATRALDRWLLDLDGHQRRARALEQEAAEVRRDLDSAKSSLDGIGEPPEDDDEALADYKDKKTARTNALSSNQGALEDILRRARSLSSEATLSASIAAGALNIAMDIAPNAPGLWDNITGALEDIGEFLGDVIEYVRDNWKDILHQIASITATVLSIASLFFPALAPFALLAVAVDMAFSAYDWSQGVPGAKEAFLGSALGLVGGFAIGKAASSFLKVAGPALATGPFTVIASGSTAAVAAPAAAVLAYNPTFGPALAGYAVIKANDAKDGADAIKSLFGGNAYYSDNLADGWRKARTN